MKQYYYKTNDCKALHATDAECICWHDEGTGPFPGHRIGVHTCHWRDKPEANKMVSDTPRTDSAYFKPHATMYDLAGEMKLMERELNLVSKERDDALAMLGMYRMKSDEQKERIKRLEEALAPLAQMTDIANDADCTVWKRAVSAQSVRLARSVLLKAKEAKP